MNSGAVLDKRKERVYVNEELNTYKNRCYPLLKIIRYSGRPDPPKSLRVYVISKSPITIQRISARS